MITGKPTLEHVKARFFDVVGDLAEAGGASRPISCMALLERGHGPRRCRWPPRLAPIISTS